MRKHATLLGLGQYIEREILARKLALEEAVEVAADALYDEGVRNLSGPLSQTQLDAMGNPYGRGFTNPRGQRRAAVKGLPINVQSDRLRSSWTKVRRGKSKIVLGFRNAPHYAKFVLSEDGTRLMRARGFGQDMTKRLKTVRLAIRKHYRKKTQ